jgi:hypothetical protein
VQRYPSHDKRERLAPPGIAVLIACRRIVMREQLCTIDIGLVAAARIVNVLEAILWDQQCSDVTGEHKIPGRQPHNKLQAHG